MDAHDQHTHRLLAEIEAGAHLSQRSLARRLGIALGLTNLLIKRLVRKGWVRMIHIKPNRVSYLLTPAGLAEKAKMSRDSLQYSMRFYAEARDRVRGRFSLLSEACDCATFTAKRIIFYGAGEVAEIGYICLQETDLTLIGVIDNTDRKRFFDVPVYSRDALKPSSTLTGAYERLVVMSFDNSETIQAELGALGVDAERIFWM